MDLKFPHAPNGCNTAQASAKSGQMFPWAQNATLAFGKKFPCAPKGDSEEDRGVYWGGKEEDKGDGKGKRENGDREKEREIN